MANKAESVPDTVRRKFVQQHLELKGPPSPPYSIDFFPYTRITNTIRVRDGKVLIRLSDTLRKAPVAVLSAAVSILLHKLYRRPLPQHQRRLYRDYISQPAIRSCADLNRRKRGRKELKGAQGEVFDLGTLFDRINQEYFDGRLGVSILSWTVRKGRRNLGHYDPAYDAIVVSRALDVPTVPEYVVCYVLYHEMLHAHLGTLPSKGPQRIHHSDFLEAERRFADYRRAKEFIRRYFGGRPR